MGNIVTKTMTSEKILSDFEVLYQQALGQEEWSLALKIKESQGKFFLSLEKTNSVHRTLPPVEALEDEELEMLLGK